ncbi:MAG: O-antigen ligase family protein, partial [Deltaproteobacteria bacterium]|nr:O-antigen ligase family protein [Deltaproteobacteria bacterium]
MTTWIKRNYPAIPILVVILGTAMADQAFSKFRIGPLFPSEICFVSWAILALHAGWHRSVRASELKKTAFTGMAGFFSWGMLLLLYDFTVRRSQMDFGAVSYSMMRVLQHAVLFVYPLLWMTAGFLTFRRSPQSVTVLGYGIMAAGTLVALVRGPHSLNIGMGPVAAVGLMVLVARSWRKHPVWLLALQSCVLGLAVLFPFARAVALGDVQRVGMAELMMLILTVPFIYNGKSHAARSLAQGAFVLGAFFGVIVATVALVTPSGGRSLTETLSRQAATSVRHGDDYPGAKIEENRPTNTILLSAYRRFWWSRAYRDWLENPVFGRGFIPEIPSYVLESAPNDGHFENIPDFTHHFVNKPLAGPHNSYLSVLARTGVIGSLLFLLFMA